MSRPTTNIAMDKDYSKREIDSHFEHLKEFIEEKLNELAKDITDIKIQTTKTNGRVTYLEKENNKNNGWIKGLASCIFIITALASYIFTSMVDPARIGRIAKEALGVQTIK